MHAKCVITCASTCVFVGVCVWCVCLFCACVGICVRSEDVFRGVCVCECMCVCVYVCLCGWLLFASLLS